MQADDPANGFSMNTATTEEVYDTIAQMHRSLAEILLPTTFGGSGGDTAVNEALERLALDSGHEKQLLGAMMMEVADLMQHLFEGVREVDQRLAVRNLPEVER